MVAERIVSEVQGVVCAANERGVKLQGGADWINFSKFGPAIAPPATGAVVVLGLDKAGYIREITTGAEKPAPAPPSQAERNVLPPGNSLHIPDRETRITRSASMNAAIELLRTRGSIDVEAAFALAERIEAWVCR